MAKTDWEVVSEAPAAKTANSGWEVVSEAPATPTKWTGATLPDQQLQQLEADANAGDASAQDVLRAYKEANPTGKRITQAEYAAAPPAKASAPVQKQAQAEATFLPLTSGTLGGIGAIRSNTDTRSVLERGEKLPPAAGQNLVNLGGVSPQYVGSLEAQFNAMPEAQRGIALQQAIAANPENTVKGRAFRVIAERNAAWATALPTAKKLDPRLEAVKARIAQEYPERAARYPELIEQDAKRAISRGQLEDDYSQVSADVVGEQADIAAKARAKELEGAGFLRRVGAGAASQYTKSGMGILNIYADALEGAGLIRSDIGKNLTNKQRIEEARAGAIPQGESIFEKSAQGAMTSLATQAPLMVLSAITGTAAPVLAQAFFQQLGDSYGEGKAAGLSGGTAFARAMPMAVAEVFFERFGMTKALAGLKTHVAKYGPESIYKYMTEAIAREIPPELATTLTQYGIDALPGIGLNKNPNLVDLYKQLEETLRQTVLQAGVTSAATVGGVKAAQKSKEALQKFLPEQRKGYKQDTSYEGLASLIAQSKGFDFREKHALGDQGYKVGEFLRAEREGPALGGGQVDTGAEGPALGEGQISTTDTRVEPTLEGGAATTAAAPVGPTPEEIENAAAGFMAAGVPRTLALQMAKKQLVEQATKAAAAAPISQDFSKLTAWPDVLLAETLRLQQNKPEPNQPLVDAIQAEIQRRAQTQGAPNATGTESAPSGGSAGVAGESVAGQPTGGFETPTRNGVVSSEPNAGVTTTGKISQPPTVTTGAPTSVTTPTKTKQTKTQGQPTPVTKVKHSIAQNDEGKWDYLVDGEVAGTYDTKRQANTKAILERSIAKGDADVIAKNQQAHDAAMTTARGRPLKVIPKTEADVGETATEDTETETTETAEGETATEDTETAKPEAPIVLQEAKTVRGDALTGPSTKVKLSDNSEHEINRQDSTTTMGLPGWHDVNAGTQNSYLADTKAEAIQELIRRQGEKRTAAAKEKLESAATQKIEPAEKKLTAEEKFAARAKANVTANQKTIAEKAKAAAEAKVKADARAGREKNEEQEQALRDKAEAEIDAGPIGEALRRIEDGDRVETKAQLRPFMFSLEKNGVLDDISDIQEALSDREQTADDVLDIMRDQLETARDDAIDERVDELTEEAEQEAEQEAKLKVGAPTKETKTKAPSAADALTAETQEKLQELEDLLGNYNTNPDAAAAKASARNINRIANDPAQPKAVRERAKKILVDEIDTKDLVKGSRYLSSKFTQSPADKAFGKFTTASQAISHILRTGTKFQKTLAARLRGFVQGVNFVVVEKGQAIPAGLTKKSAEWSRSIAMYDRASRTIYVRGESYGNKQGVNHVTVLHELLHAATARKIDLAMKAIKDGVSLDSPLVQAALTLHRTMENADAALRELARQGNITEDLANLAVNGKAFNDLHEFLAYGMTDKTMQDFLLKTKGVEGDTHLFNRFVDSMRRMFGMGKDSINALSDLILATDQLLSAREIGGSIKETGTHAATSQTRVQPSADVARLAKMLGSKLYGTPENIAAVSIKELFQNSFDAIKGAIEKGTLKSGDIKIKIDPSTRSIQIIDNGLGMPTSVMGGQFLQIAGTVKETKRASGGLGVAKMLFLFENKELEVVSLRDGVLSRMVTTGDDLKAALNDPERGPIIETTSDADVVARYTKELFPDGHGTSVRVQVPETYINESNGEESKIPFNQYDLPRAPVLLDSPLFDNIKVSIDTGYGPDTLPIGANFPVDKFTPFANVKFAWGTARIYVGTDKLSYVERNRGNAHILSNGLWQFNLALNDKPGHEGKPIKRDFYIDVTPNENVKPEDAGYPFDLNRQNFSKVASKDFKKIFDYVTAIYSQLDLASSVKNFGTTQYVNSNGTLTKAETLEPKVPISDNAFTVIKPDDKVEVREGVLYVNNRALPELTEEDLKKTGIRLEELTIPQDEVDSSRVMIHDNTVLKSSKVPKGQVIPILELDNLTDKNPGKYKLEMLPRPDVRFTVVNDDGSVMVFEDTAEEIFADLQGLGFIPKETENKEKSLSDAAREKFGDKAYNKYISVIGETFHKLRDALVNVNSDYAGLSTQVIGVSLDNKYYGVSIMIPFKGMFINPATTALQGSPAQIAVSLIGTMTHELAHFKQRNHDASFATEMQKVVTLLDTHPSFSLQQIKADLTLHIADNIEIFNYLNKEFQDGNLEPRGNRFQDASYEQIGDEGSVEPMESTSGTGKGQPSVPQGAGQSTTGAGQVGVPKGVGGKTPRTGKELDTDVSKAVKKVAESRKGVALGDALADLSKWRDPRYLWGEINGVWDSLSDSARTFVSHFYDSEALAYAGPGDIITGLKDAHEAIQKMSGSVQTYLRGVANVADEIVDFYRAEPKKRQAFEDLVHASTLAKYDPANPNNVLRNNKLDNDYAALGDKGQKAYKRLRDYYKSMNAVKQHLLEENLNKLGLTAAARKKLLSDVRVLFEADKVEPYFPLARFGDFVLETGKKGSHATYRFDTKKERDRAAREFARQQGKSVDDLRKDGELRITEDLNGDGLRINIEGTSKLLKAAYAAVDSASVTDPNIKQKLKDDLYQAYLAAMPENSVRKMFVHRKGTPGFSSDVLRAVNDSGSRMARAFAKLEHANAIRQAIDLSKRQLEGNEKYTAFFMRMNEIASEALQPRIPTGKEKWLDNVANVIVKASFLRNLTSWSSAIMQPMDILLKGAPVLTGNHGPKAMAELSKMMKLHNQYGVLEKMPNGTMRFRAPSIEFAKGLTPQERLAVRDMVDVYGVTRDTLANEVFSQAREPATKINSKAFELGKDAVHNLVLGGLMHHGERLSREIIALTSFRLNMAELQKANPNDPTNYDEAVKAAIRETNEVLGNYNANNKPMLMRGAGGRLVTMYKFFPLVTTKLLVTNFSKMLPMFNKEGKAAAATKFFGVLGTHTLFGGLVALPAFSLVMGLLQAAWEKWQKDPDAPDEMRDIDYETWWRTVWLPENLGSTGLAQLAEYGLLNKLTGFDISSRISLNDMWFRDPQPGKNAKETALNWGQVMFGAAWTTGLNAIQGIDLMTQGEYERGLEKLTPASISKLMVAHRYATEGVQTPQGVQLIEKGKVPKSELVGQAIGYAPARVAEAQTTAFKAQAAEKVIVHERETIMGTLKNSFRKSIDPNKDTEVHERFDKIFQDTLDKATDFSLRNPEREIKGEEITKALNDELKRVVETEMGSGIKMTKENVRLLSPSIEKAERALAPYK